MQVRCNMRWKRLPQLVVFLCCAAVATPGARADQNASGVPSLQLIPADATFYSAMLRNGEQWRAISQSRAWAKLKSSPLVQMAWQQLQNKLNEGENPLAAFRQALGAPENRELIGLLGDMFSDEAFTYGGPDFADVAQLTSHLNGAYLHMMSHSLPDLMSGQAPGGGKKAQVRAYLEVLSENRELIKVPDIVVGFKTSMPGAAKNQLKRLASLVENALSQRAGLDARFKAENIGGGDFLVLTLSGASLPWDNVSLENYEDTAGEFDPLVKKIKDLKLTLSLGVHNGYMLVAISGSTAALTRLGHGDKLVDRPEFKPLKAFSSKPLTSVAYTSETLRRRVQTSKEDLEKLRKRLADIVDKVVSAEDIRKQLQVDLKECFKDIGGFFGTPGAALQFSFLNGHGTEGFSYDWSTHRNAESSRPLTLLDHVGGNPLCAVVEQHRPSGEGYQMLVKWLKLGSRYFDDLVVPKMDPDEKDRYEKMTKWAFPLLKRFDETTRNLLLPSREGQSAFVLDANLTSTQWIAQMPQSDQPLPLIAPALVVGIKDANSLRSAFAQYREILNEAIKNVAEMSNGRVSEIQIPEPETKDLKVGTLYYYNLPPVVQLDPAILPNAALSKDVFALSLSEYHAKRLLEKKPLKTDTGLLQENDGKLTSAAYWNCAATIDALKPWVKYGVRLAGPKLFHNDESDGEEKKPSPKSPDEIVKQIEQLLDVLKVLRSYTSCSYLKDGALITHRESIVRDID